MHHPMTYDDDNDEDDDDVVCRSAGQPFARLDGRGAFLMTGATSRLAATRVALVASSCPEVVYRSAEQPLAWQARIPLVLESLLE